MRHFRAIALLLFAALVVALAILADGQTARTVNGIGGLLWIGAAVLLLRQLRSETRLLTLLSAAAGITLILVIVTRPSDYLTASIGFAVGGAAIAFMARTNLTLWSATIPALWLPVHLLVAIGRVIDREMRDIPATVRTDPPPTSAFVPFAMVVAALAGGLIVRGLKSRSALGGGTNRQRATRPVH